MHLELSEIESLAESLASRVADVLEERFSKRPEWCFSPSEAAAWANIPEDAIRHAIRAGKLPCVKIGNNIRIKRSDLFAAKQAGGEGE